MKHEFDDGKYTVEFTPDGNLKALRHGEAWRDLAGDKLVYWMLVEVDRLKRQMCAESEAQLAAAQQAAVPLGYIHPQNVSRLERGEPVALRKHGWDGEPGQMAVYAAPQPPEAEKCQSCRLHARVQELEERLEAVQIGVPDRYKVVPIEPTPEMYDRVLREGYYHEDEESVRAVLRSEYQDMLGAAPTQIASSQIQKGVRQRLPVPMLPAKRALHVFYEGKERQEVHGYEEQDMFAYIEADREQHRAAATQAAKRGASQAQRVPLSDEAEQAAMYRWLRDHYHGFEHYRTEWAKSQNLFERDIKKRMGITQEKQG